MCAWNFKINTYFVFDNMYTTFKRCPILSSGDLNFQKKPLFLKWMVLPVMLINTKRFLRFRQQKLNARRIGTALAYTINGVMVITGTFAHTATLTQAYLAIRVPT